MTYALIGTQLALIFYIIYLKKELGYKQKYLEKEEEITSDLENNIEELEVDLKKEIERTSELNVEVKKLQGFIDQRDNLILDMSSKQHDKIKMFDATLSMLTEGVFHDTQNDTIVILENLERIGEQ